MARKTVRVSDLSGDEIPEGSGAVVRVTYRDANKGAFEFDVTDDEALALSPGLTEGTTRKVGKRGRKAAVTA